MEYETTSTSSEEQIVNEKLTIAPGEIIIGTLEKLSSIGEPCVNFQGNPDVNLLKAISTVGVSQEHVGKQVALLFANGDIRAPVIMGIIHNPLQEILENSRALQPSHFSGFTKLGML